MSDKTNPEAAAEAKATVAEAATDAPETFDFGAEETFEGEGVEMEGGDETITALIQQITDLSAERDDLKDKLMRSLAEAENTRRRAERDRKDAEAFGGTKLARDLLEVHDNFDRALASAMADVRGRSRAGHLHESIRQPSSVSRRHAV